MLVRFIVFCAFQRGHTCIVVNPVDHENVFCILESGHHRKNLDLLSSTANHVITDRYKIHKNFRIKMMYIQQNK